MGGWTRVGEAAGGEPGGPDTVHACMCRARNVSASPQHTFWREKSREVQIKEDPQQPPLPSTPGLLLRKN